MQKRTAINKYGKRITLSKTTESGAIPQVEKILDEAHIKYEAEYKFADEKPTCKYAQKKRYDLAVFDKAGNLSLLIEYDGGPHFTKKYWADKGTRPERTKIHVVKTQMKDAYKDYLAYKHHIPVLRINSMHEKELRDLILCYVYLFVDKHAFVEDEISSVDMLDKYGFDFVYVKPSEPSKVESKFLTERDERLKEGF